MSVPSGATVCSTPLSLIWNNASKTPYVSNVWILAPGDFSYTPGTPLTFDRSNPYRISNTFKQRFANGCGTMRPPVSGFGSFSNTSEPWDEQQLGCFSWNISNFSGYTIGYSELRPVNLSVSPYVYGEWVGSAFSLTLNTGVNATATSFSINAGTADAYEIPISGLVLVMGSGEKCRIQLATFVSGSTYTCIVERGSSGTTAAVQNAGTISCLGRLTLTSSSQLGGQILEVVTSGCSYWIDSVGISYSGPNHNLKTGIEPVFSGGPYPTMTFTDSSQVNLSGFGLNIAVTGPTTFVVDAAPRWFWYIDDHVCVKSGELQLHAYKSWVIISD